jgi:hypothetical protein
MILPAKGKTIKAGAELTRPSSEEERQKQAEGHAQKQQKNIDFSCIIHSKSEGSGCKTWMAKNFLILHLNL